jgi:hypothetical protein
MATGRSGMPTGTPGSLFWPAMCVPGGSDRAVQRDFSSQFFASYSLYSIIYNESESRRQVRAPCILSFALLHAVAVVRSEKLKTGRRTVCSRHQFVGAIHGRQLTAWSTDGIILAGILVAGVICNLLIKPLADK